jgi:hypothetical protein
VPLSGQRRLFRKGNRMALRASELNFDLIAWVLLTALAIVTTLIFPEILL